MGDIYRHDINLKDNQSITMFSKRSTPYNKAELARLLYMQGYKDQTTGLRVNTSSGSVVLYDTTGQNTDGAMTQKATTDALSAALETAKAQWLLDMNPVGTIIENNTGTNPGTYIGGHWVLYGSGRVTVCINGYDTSFDTVGKTGGSKALQQHTHTATFTGNAITGQHSPIPEGKSTAWANGCFSVPASATKFGGIYQNATGDGRPVTFNATPSGTITIDNAGDGNSGNLQPYVVVYRWIRIE